jgi:hypothetical protein
MMDRLLARGLALGRARATMLAALIEQAAREELPADVTVEPFEGGLTLAGRRLARRMFDDARLRGIGLLAKGRMR